MLQCFSRQLAVHAVIWATVTNWLIDCTPHTTSFVPRWFFALAEWSSLACETTTPPPIQLLVQIMHATSWGTTHHDWRVCLTRILLKLLQFIAKLSPVRLISMTIISYTAPHHTRSNSKTLPALIINRPRLQVSLETPPPT